MQSRQEVGKYLIIHVCIIGWVDTLKKRQSIFLELWKITVEPESTPLEKEKHLQTTSFWVPSKNKIKTLIYSFSLKFSCYRRKNPPNTKL